MSSLIAVILDASSSMSHLKNKTLEALNSFIQEQQKIPGECKFTLCTFNTSYDFVYNNIDLASINEITSNQYNPGGMTALTDAMGRTIDMTGVRLAAMPESERPDKIIIVTLTDGAENSSNEYTKSDVINKITHQREKYNWQFIFLGADENAIADGTSYGIAARSSLSYNATQKGMGQVFNSTSSVVGSFRSGNLRSVSYSQQDRDNNSDDNS